MTLEFYLPKKGLSKNIYLKVTDAHLKKPYSFVTTLRISPEEWDDEQQRPANIYEKKYKKLNKKLNAIRVYLAESLKSIKDGEQVFCKRTLARKIKELCMKEQVEYPSSSLLYYIQQYISNRKETVCHSTHKRYKVFFHLIERFEGYTMKRLYVDTLDADFISDFIHFGKEEKYSANTVYRTIHFVKTILNFVERKGIRTAVRELEVRREKQHKEMITLTENEIKQIEQTKVPKELQPAKDWLLISCYTGQRFSDFMNFQNEQMRNIQGKKCLCFVQKKTKKEIILPLHPTVLHTIERNSNEFPKPMTIQNYNHQIRAVAKLSNLKDVVRARKLIGFRSIDVEMEKWATLSSHIGRRSFATNFYGKIPTPLLMEATGHTTENVFLKYINPVDENRVISLSNYFNKIYEEKSDDEIKH